MVGSKQNQCYCNSCRRGTYRYSIFTKGIEDHSWNHDKRVSQFDAGGICGVPRNRVEHGCFPFTDQGRNITQVGMKDEYSTDWWDLQTLGAGATMRPETG